MASTTRPPAGGQAGDIDGCRREADSPVAAAAAALVEALGELATLTSPNMDEASDHELHDLDDYEQLQLGELLLGTNLQEVKENLRQEVSALLSKFLRPERVLLRDKLTFVLGILNMILSAYWLGWSPQSFYRLYTAEAGILLVLRFMHYRWSRQHYYLLDWCYFSNALLVLQIYRYPTSVLLAKIMFAHAFGPLLWSILAFRNSIVPHSVDKMTSHFMHWYPACVCWATRWHPSDVMAVHLQSSTAAREQWESAGLQNLVLLPLLPYLLWALLYYIKVFVVSSKKIQQRGYDTLFTYSTASRTSLFGAVVLRAPHSLQPLVYMAAHLLLTMATMLLNTIWWRSFWANTAFMMCILAASAWSGATFYFDYFAHTYVAKLNLSKRSGNVLSSFTSQSTTTDTKKCS